jgi:methionine-rich copper-binding protein CopC
VTTSPARVEITFNQQIQKIAGTYGIEVTRDRGAAVTTGQAVVNDGDRTKLSVTLQPDLPPGRYVVNWKNTSDADGDPIEGAFSFYVNTQPTTVDLANDAQLAQIGFEEATAEAGTPAAGSTDAATPAATAGGTRSPATSAATPVPTSGPSTSNDGGSNAVLYVIVAFVAVAVLVGLGAWQYTIRRGA